VARWPEIEPWTPLNDASKLACLDLLFFHLFTFHIFLLSISTAWTHFGSFHLQTPRIYILVVP
jgi:hypothetical protein